MFQTVSRGVILAVGLMFCAAAAQAQQYAALVMDARTGKVIQATNADTRVHPASLTKMMTLYIVFDQVRQGRLSLDQKIIVSANAAAQPPSRLGLKTGQKIELRYLIRAAAIKSANDAATAMGDAIGGSEEGFARMMNQYARAMGMTGTTFKNANGLTRDRAHVHRPRHGDAGPAAGLRLPAVLQHLRPHLDLGRHRHGEEHQPPGAGSLSGRGRHQDRLHQGGGLQRRLLGAARRQAGDRGAARRQVVAARATPRRSG